MKIGLQFAMPAEFHALPGAKELEAFETVSGVPFYEAAPGIIACAGGVSKVNAAMAAEILCLKYGVDMIVNAGVAGCLTEIPTGSLVVAEDFVQHDVDTSAIGDPVGLVSTVNRVSFPTWKPESRETKFCSIAFLPPYRPSREPSRPTGKRICSQVVNTPRMMAAMMISMVMIAFQGACSTSLSQSRI